MVSSPTSSLFENLPPRPPTPPRDTDRDIIDALAFLSDSFETDPTNAPPLIEPETINTPPQQSPSLSAEPTFHGSRSGRKKVDFSPWTDYHKADDYFALRKINGVAASPLRPLPQPRDPKTLKSILKPHDPPLTYDSDSTSQSPHKYENFSEMLEAMVKQLAGGSRPHKLDSYVTLLSTLKAYEDKPDTDALINKIGLLTQFIRRDTAIVNDTEKQDCQLAVQALKLLMALMRLPAVAEEIPEDFQAFFLDRSIEQFGDPASPKAWINPLIFAFSQQRFGPRIMTADRANRAITALQDIEDRVSGSNVVVHRLLVYQKLLDQARPVMIARVSDWLQHIFHPMLSSNKETRVRGVDVGALAGVDIGDVPQVSRATVDIMNKEVEKGGTYGEYFAGRLNKMLADEETAQHVPHIWAVIMLLMRSRRRKIEQWKLLKKWLEIFQRCVNSSNREVAAQANVAWNRFVYAMRPDESTSQPVRSLLRQAIVAQFERRGTDKEARRMRQSAFSSYCNLLYYAFPPTASAEQLDMYWREFVVQPLAKMVQIDQKAASTACRVLTALFKGNNTRIWNERLAIESPNIGPNDLPRVDPRWTRQRLGMILQLVEPCLAGGSWTHIESTNPLSSISSEAPPRTMWTALVLAVAEAGSKEVTVSMERKEAIAHIMNLLHRIWTNRPLSLGTEKGHEASWIDKFGDLVVTTLETLGPGPFADAILSRTASSDFEAVLTPSHRSKARGTLQSPLLHLLHLSSTSVGLDELKLADLAKQIMQLCCNAKPSRKLKFELLRDCVQTITDESRPELRSGMWCIAVEMMATTLQCSNADGASQHLGEEYRCVTKVLINGLYHGDDQSLIATRTLYEALVSTVRHEAGDGAVTVAVTEPLAEALQSPNAAFSQLASVHLATLALTGINHPRHRKSVEQARKNLWGVSSGLQKPADFDPYNHLYKMVVSRLQTAYGALGFGTSRTDLAVGFLTALCSFIQRWPVSFAAIMLRKMQDGIACWIEDEQQKLTGASEQLQGVQQAVVHLWNIVMTAVEGLPRKDSTILQLLEVLISSGFSSRRKTIVNRAIETWNATFGKELSLQYPPKVERALRRLQPIVDLSLPNFPDAAAEDAGPLPFFSFTESQEGLSAVVDECSAVRSHQPSPAPRRLMIHSSSPMPPTSNSSRRLKSPGIRPTPKPRFRHDDSQIQFAPIESPPGGDAADSQMLTDRQKEVRERQEEAAAMFADISSSPIREPRNRHLDLPKYPIRGKTPSVSDAESRSGTPTLRDQGHSALDNSPSSSPTPKSRRSSQGSRENAALSPIDVMPSVSVAEAMIESDPPSSPPRLNKDHTSPGDSTRVQGSFVGRNINSSRRLEKTQETLDEQLVAQLVDNASHLSDTRNDAEGQSSPVSFSSDDFSSGLLSSDVELEVTNQLALEVQAHANRANTATKPQTMPDDTTVAGNQTPRTEIDLDATADTASETEEEESSFEDLAKHLPQGTANSVQDTAPAKIVLEDEDEITETKLETSPTTILVDSSPAKTNNSKTRAHGSPADTTVEDSFVFPNGTRSTAQHTEKAPLARSSTQTPNFQHGNAEVKVSKPLLKRKDITPVVSKVMKQPKKSTSEDANQSQVEPSQEDSDSSVDSDDSILSCIVVDTEPNRRQAKAVFCKTAQSESSQEKPEAAKTAVPSEKRASTKASASASSYRASPRLSGAASELPLPPTRKRKSRSSQSTNVDPEESKDESVHDVVEDTPAPKKRRGRPSRSANEDSSQNSEEHSQASRVRKFSHVEVSRSSGDEMSIDEPHEDSAPGISKTKSEKEKSTGKKSSNAVAEPEIPASRQEAISSASQSQSPTLNDIANRPKLQPKSILDRLKQMLADCKHLVLGRDEEREIDDALFEVRREIHEAARRGRGG